MKFIKYINTYLSAVSFHILATNLSVEDFEQPCMMQSEDILIMDNGNIVGITFLMDISLISLCTGCAMFLWQHPLTLDETPAD